ncbi:nuclear envelope pore membrane protein POM 121C-like isoform X2 [Dendrobates tinctorius]|uniref:nuclear envelope pore membrane protein POM 121C-like isoform X2 n=1 Tax=Dendrobates tinctorius TaxID=92724 RepID=UPI003CC986D6
MENKSRRQVSNGIGESSAESPVVNGSLTSGSKSDTLKRALNTLDETSNKCSRTSSNGSLSSCTINGFTMSSHNAITSSLSSSRVLLQKSKRNYQNTSVISSPSSSRSQMPDVFSKKARSDTLKRALNTLDETSNKCSRTSSNGSLSSCTINGFTMSSHNAITSSLSSSRVLLQKSKRNYQNTSVISSPSSSRSQMPDVSSKKARDDTHETGLSTPVKSGSGNQLEDFNTTLSSKSSDFKSSDNRSSGSRRKKVLLVCLGRDDHYPLPPPPIPGYNVTSKDLDNEKKAFLQRLNKALEEPAANTTSALTSQSSTASSNPLLQSLAKMQSKDCSQGSTKGPCHI